ncbi:DUF7448 domain-containing protein [Bacillus sp. FSL K6-3431]|uniref:DUF7448 domain-containing protein n=1 Tax=Bacillus sp. FSL K6-3431 TaxID=2921500 RepID=UPI0030F6B537
MSYWRNSDGVEIGELVGKTLKNVEVDKREFEIHFHTTNNEHYVMYHEQDCCESVEIEDINGDIADLLGEPILMAEEVSQDGESEWGTQTWTFYKVATIKGTVVLRWLGESNGYYSESVDFVKMREDAE